MNMQTEPIRLPLWLASLLAVVVVPFLIALLTDVELKQAAAQALAAVIPLLGAGEIARRTAWSPESHEQHVDHVVTIAGGMPDPDTERTTGAPDTGAVAWGTLALCVIAAVAVLYAFGKLPL